MDFIPTNLFNILSVSMIFSTIMVVAIQKLKTLSLIKKSWQIWFLNLLLSFALGIPFAIEFYNLEIYEAAWVSVFTFIGAPALYDLLKNQKVINYTPSSIKNNNNIEISNDNIIKR